MYKSVTVSGLNDGQPPDLLDSAIRNYWLLRERIAELERMIKGLQDHTRTKCLINNSMK
ncbi:lysis protein [Providencia stuartii]|nr:lysis system i-spanin subunit Rz [Providencia stuartii]EMA3641105.1 lysis protein [Providencia stuartii]MBW3102999.1 lysis protein [Providencia stuartii]MCB5217670.1 lysis system i-spanin subunit Rz [Providencia stuartii]MEB3133733.1 lysis system i-spanin subunit Rz [Providencia stuartii]HEM6900777.1 lysis protein [Providencia stuartii]